MVYGSVCLRGMMLHHCTIAEDRCQVICENFRRIFFVVVAPSRAAMLAALGGVRCTGAGKVGASPHPSTPPHFAAAGHNAAAAVTNRLRRCPRLYALRAGGRGLAYKMHVLRRKAAER